MNSETGIKLAVILEKPGYPRWIGDNTETLKPGQIVEIYFSYMKGKTNKMVYFVRANIEDAQNETGWVIPEDYLEIIGEL